MLSTNLPAKRYSGGLATVYGTEIETLGVADRMYYNIDHQTCFGPMFTYFPVTTHQIGNEKLDVSLTEFNFNGHHHLYFGIDNLGFYPLGGINYSIETIANEHKSVFGFNLGAGLHYNKRGGLFSLKTFILPEGSQKNHSLPRCISRRAKLIPLMRKMS